MPLSPSVLLELSTSLNGSQLLLAALVPCLWFNTPLSEEREAGTATPAQEAA